MPMANGGHRRLIAWLGGLRAGTVGLLSGLLVCLLCAAAAWAALRHDRAALFGQAESELAAISISATDIAARGLGTLDLTVTLAVREFHEGRLDMAGVYARLRGQADALDQLQVLNRIVVVDDRGIVRHTRDERFIGLDMSGRQYFTSQRDRLTSGMLIGAPVDARFAPTQQFVPVSWALRTENGDFAGVISVGIARRLYARLFDGLTSMPGQTVALIDGVGRLYVMDSRHWPAEAPEPSPPSFLAETTVPGGRGPQAGVAGDYLIATAAVPGYDLQVVAGIPLAEVLGPWWLRLYFTSGLILALSLLLGLLYRTVQQLQATVIEAKAAQAKAEEGEEVKVQFLAAMSHEIRTPMTSVLGMADLLATERMEARLHSYVQAIQSSGQHLLSIINDVLDFSRFGAGGLQLERVDFSVTGLLEQIRAMMAPQATERGLYLIFDLDEHSPPVVRGDPTRLRQILVNLIGNGLKFTYTGGVTVTIRCQPSADRKVIFRFAVEDTGIGIPEGRLGALFQPFMQADRSTARRFGGSGLGLAICRQLVELMGGRIAVVSRAGKGSQFWFEVPLQLGDVVTSARTVLLEPSKIRPLRILVAEDVAVNRDLLQAILTRHGHAVTFAENGIEAVAKAGEDSFDIVLMDIQMPVMDGIDATRRIRTLPPPHGTVPIVALTANVMDAERQRCLAAGMTGVLTKPVNWDDLLGTLARVAEQAAPPGALQAVAGQPAPDSLLNHQRIAGLKNMTGPERLAQFLDNALASAEQLAAEIHRLKDDLMAVTKPAHRLAGMAPSFGLTRIGLLGRAVEQRAHSGQPVDELAGELQQAVAKTKLELSTLMICPR